MLTHLLVPLDGSARAESALPVVERIARATGSQITLLQVLSYPVALGLPDGSAPLGAQVDTEEEAETASYLTRLAGEPLFSGLTVATRVVVGTPAAAILECAHEEGADLIVLCSHGRTGPTRWVLGSVAEHVVRQSPVPVLVLREHEATQDHLRADPEHPLRVLMPLDGSRLAEAAIDPAAQMALALAGQGAAALHLITVLAPYDVDPDRVPAVLVVDGVRAYLQRMADQTQARYPRLSVSWAVIADYDVAATLVHSAEIGDDTENAGSPTRCDLIAMATHGMSGIPRWVLGSITERVLHHTTLPLLIVRPSMLAKKPRPAELAAAHSAIQPEQGTAG